jgi:alcohol dehydrogenase class IV
LISENLLAAMRTPDNLEVREKMAIGSLFGGFCLGISNALLLSHVLRFNLPAAKRYADIAVTLGASPASSHIETGLRGIKILENLAVDAGIPMRLHDWNISIASLRKWRYRR